MHPITAVLAQWIYNKKMRGSRWWNARGLRFLRRGNALSYKHCAVVAKILREDAEHALRNPWPSVLEYLIYGVIVASILAMACMP